jgi:3-deoxy-D-manno-octulosonic-acid transferase
MILYNLSIRLLGAILYLGAWFHPKAKKWIQGRKNWMEKLPELENRTVVWFHCASLGEFEQGRPIIEAWRTSHPEDFIVLTFFSPSGYEVRKDYNQVDYCCYLPLDTPKNARHFIAHFQPKFVFFIKYEFWLNYIHAAANCGAQLISLSAIFRPEQRFFKWYGRDFRNALKRFELFFVQNTQSQQLLNSIGIEPVIVSGDTRYDRVSDRVLENNRNEIIERWTSGKYTFVVGSSWPADEAIFAATLLKHAPDKLIIAPHEISEATIRRLEELFKGKTCRYTDAELGGSIPDQCSVLILNCVGVLADAYRYGSTAYVGGGFKTGLHNILEPAAFGLPVIFGPHHHKFPEAKDFMDAGVGFSIKDAEEFEQCYFQIMAQKEEWAPKVKGFIASKTGARSMIISALS